VVSKVVWGRMEPGVRMRKDRMERREVDSDEERQERC